MVELQKKALPSSSRFVEGIRWGCLVPFNAGL
jgi:hypothetical protein